MKKLKYLVMAALICISALLCSCGTTKIEGRPSAVVDQAQDLKNGAEATVEVTGYVSDVLGAMLYLTDEEEGRWATEDSVQCAFDDESALEDIEKGDRITVSGELTAEDLYIDSSMVWLRKCELK